MRKVSWFVCLGLLVLPTISSGFPAAAAKSPSPEEAEKVATPQLAALYAEIVGIGSVCEPTNAALISLKCFASGEDCLSASGCENQPEETNCGYYSNGNPKTCHKIDGGCCGCW